MRGLYSSKTEIRNHTGVVVSVDQNCRIIDQNLLHLEDDIFSLFRIHFTF